MTKIEWTDETWNPIRGCSRVSKGCRNCYAEGIAGRFGGVGMPYEGLVTVGLPGKKSTKKWNGQIKFVEEHLLDPLKWKGRPIYDASTGKRVGFDKGLRIFVNSMSDLFHENVTDEMRDRIFAVMALCPQHTFQILTKRPERMLEYLGRACGRIADLVIKMRADRGDRGCVGPLPHLAPGATWWPLANVWLGVSVEDQKTADERLDFLCELASRGWQTMVSFEPLLSAVDPGPWWLSLGNRTWAIVGGESGPGARPMHPDWARSLRDQCEAAGVPFFFKQWGEWSPIVDRDKDDPDWRLNYTKYKNDSVFEGLNIEGGCGFHGERYHVFQRIGKKAAGHLLDGKEWHQFPAGAR